tara:strand:- start:216 stop:4082 length:3867 start_codon:yes stop_codon:yes gene_type:complete
MATPNIVPRIDSEGGLGTASKYWGSAYINALFVDGQFVYDNDTGNQPFYITRSGAITQALSIKVMDDNVRFESIQDETADNHGGFEFNMDGGVTEPDFTIRKSGGTNLFNIKGDGAATFAGDVTITSDGSDADGANIVLKHSNNNTTDVIGSLIFGNGADTSLSSIVVNTATNNTTSDMVFNTSSTGTLGAVLTLDASKNATFAGTVHVGGESLTIENSSAEKPLIQLKATSNSAEAGHLKFIVDRGQAPVDGDTLGSIVFIGEDSGQNATTYSEIRSDIHETTDGDESGELFLSVANNGTLQTGLFMKGDKTTAAQVDVTIGNGAASKVTIPGTLNGIPFFSDAGGGSMYTHNVTATQSTAELNTAYGFSAMNAITTGDNNTALGFAAGGAINSGSENVAIGAYAGDALTTGVENVAVGYEALSTEDAHGKNVAIGRRALKLLNAGADGLNTAVGHQAGAAMTTGTHNTVLGASAGAALTSGGFNVALGYLALGSEDTRGRVVALGYQALTTQNADADTYNVAIGFNAGLSVSTGVQNTLIGGLAGDSLNTGNYNVAVGYESLGLTTLGASNVAVGNFALNENVKTNANVAIGQQALQSNIGDGSTDNQLTYNTAVGYFAGKEITSGVQNTLIGGQAGDALETGQANAALGYNALGASVDGNHNTAIGCTALEDYEGGNGEGHNTAIGSLSQSNATTGEFNTSLGTLSMGVGVTTGDYNVALGYKALEDATSANYNIALGAQALLQITTGDQNVAVGYNALSSDLQGGRSVAIGDSALATLNVGNANSYNVAIGYTAGTAITTGIQNTLIGGLAGDGISLGANNVALGYLSLSAVNAGSKSVAIGSGALQIQTPQFTNTTCILTNTDATVTVDATSAIKVGMAISGTGVPSGTTVASVNSSTVTSFEMSAVANAGDGSSDVTLTFTGGVDSSNTAVGYLAGNAMTTGTENNLFGALAGDSLTTGANNVATGHSALGQETTGSFNTAIGHKSLATLNVNGEGYNTAVGYRSGVAMTTGVKNTLIGAGSGDALTEGHSNTAVGYESLSTSLDGDGNTAMGYLALRVYEGGDGEGFNTAVGQNAGVAVSTGQNNTIVGANAGDALTTGDNNIIIGHGAAASAVGVDNETVIGTTTTTNALVHGLRKPVVLVTSNVGASDVRSGTLYVFNDADGAVVTLPNSGATEGSTQIGATYEFFVAVTATANNHKIALTDTTNEKLHGSVRMVETSGDAEEFFAGQPGDNFSAIIMNGTTTGILGSRITITNIKADMWSINGTILNTGTSATPFSTS